MLKYIIFDYGGVVGDNTGLYEKVSRKFNIDKNELKEKVVPFLLLSQRNKISNDDFWIKVSKEFKINEPEKLKKTWLEIFAKYSALNEGVIKIVIALRKREEYKLILLSNVAYIYKDALPFREKLEKYFDYIYNSFDLEFRKPDARTYRYVLSHSGAGAEECVFIDNQNNNLEIPQKLGSKTILFKNSEQLKKSLVKSNLL